MLVPFVLDPDALECDKYDLSVSISLQRRILTEWRTNGILVHGNTPLRESEIFRKLETLPQEARKMWKVAVASNRRALSIGNWSGKFPDENLLDLKVIQHEVKVALFENTRGVIVGGLGEHEARRKEPALAGMEICKSHAVSEADAFQAATRASRESIAQGADCANEWRERYKHQLHSSSHITVVDRYLYANHQWRRAHGEISGLDHLLRTCFGRPRDKGVSIRLLLAVQNDAGIGSTELSRSVENWARDLDQQFGGGGIRALDYYICEDNEFAKAAHERYIRADYSVNGIDAGIDVLGGQKAKKGSIVWRHDNASDPRFSKIEAALQLNAIYASKIF